MLFKERALNIAILISASWHFVCMLSITPVLVSGILKPNSTTISFLGSILERIITVPEKQSDLDNVYSMQHIGDMAARGLGAVGLKPPETTDMPMHSQLDKGELASCGYRGEKPSLDLHSENRYKRGIEFGDILVAGAAKNRIVLYKPDLPKVIVLNSDFNFAHEVIVRFRISRHGFAEDLECAVSSGVPEVDEAAVRYVRRWQFVPGEEKGKEVEGRVRLVFD